MKGRDQSERPVFRQPDGVPGIQGPSVQRWTNLGGTLLLIHAVLSLAAVMLRRVWPAFDGLVGASTLSAFVIGGLIMQGGIIFLPTLLVLASGRAAAADLLGSKARAGSLILGITAGIPAAVVFQGLNNLLIYVLVRSGVHLPAAGAGYDVTGGDLFARSPVVILVITLVGVLIPGIVEELMFRGVILASLSSGGAVLSAIFWQAAAFAVFHGDPLFILPPFLAGLLLAQIRRCSDSILPAMLAHMSLNFTLLALAPLLPKLTAEYMRASGSEPTSLLYASLIAAFVAAVALVPLVVLISSLQVHRPARFRLYFWPADWKFALALLVLIATMVIEHR